MQLSMWCPKHVTKHEVSKKYEVSKACNQAWGVQGIQPSMRCPMYATEHEVSKAGNQAWGVQGRQPSTRCLRQATKHEVLKWHVKILQTKGH